MTEKKNKYTNTNHQPLFSICITLPVESASSFIPSTSPCLVHLILYISLCHSPCPHSHHPQPFSPDFKPICSTNPFHYSLSGIIWTAITDFGFGPDLTCADICFSFVFNIIFCFWLYVLTTPSAFLSTLNSLVASYRTSPHIHCRTCRSVPRKPNKRSIGP